MHCLLEIPLPEKWVLIPGLLVGQKFDPIAANRLQPIDPATTEFTVSVEKHDGAEKWGGGRVDDWKGGRLGKECESII
jgi:hypothetical protein